MSFEFVFATFNLGETLRDDKSSNIDKDISEILITEMKVLNEISQRQSAKHKRRYIDRDARDFHRV